MASWMDMATSEPQTIVVTGAFSYTGKYVTRLLLERAFKVRTLTFHPQRENEFAGKLQIFPYNFDRPSELEKSLRGASCLVNTYWIRFPHGQTTYEGAVKNTLTLINAAKRAGVQRIVHVSIANPSLDSSLGYYRGKAQLETAVKMSGLEYSIVRPTVIFGQGDILINNIAWFVRHLPVFGVPGDGRYSIRPIFVEDMAKLIVDAIACRRNKVIDAVGPETFTFEELVRRIAEEIGKAVQVVYFPAVVAYLSTRLAGFFLRDTVLTWQEYKGLMANLLAPAGPSTGQTRLTRWLAEHCEDLGVRYASEVARHYSP
jgi:uncharacterized protein YbjT (DUF2867 family)